MGIAETAELATRLSLDDRDFTTGIGRAQKSLSKFEGSLGRVGKGTGQIAGGLARVGAVGIVAVGGALAYTAKQAIDFEDAFAGVRKTVNSTDLTKAGLSFDILAKQFRELSKEIPVTSVELAAIGETAGALGIRAQDITNFTKVVAELAVTTNLTSEGAADALGRISTILGLTGKDIDRFADTLVNLGNQGASTESDIIETTKRFAAMGKQAGLTTNQILALASAATSLGAEPEAAGSALSRIFSNMSTAIALANKQGKVFAEVTGQSIKTLQGRIKKGQGLGILTDVLKALRGMDRLAAAKALKGLGITNVRDRNAILLMAQNLGFVNDQLKIAEQSTGALSREATIKFGTVASKIKLFKNVITDAAISIGAGFAPALGRAADKLAAFLKLPANQTQLENLGKDIGEFIDSIDWQQVIEGGKTIISVMKAASGAALTLLGIISKLPKEVLAIGGGALLLNKISGGLLGAGAGNIIGGLVAPVLKNAFASIPLFGRAFVQPVFVTNMGAGFGAGGPLGGIGKGGSLLKLLGIGSAVLGGLAIAAQFKEIFQDPEFQKQTDAIQKSAQAQIDSHASLAEMQSAMAATEKGIQDLKNLPLGDILYGGQIKALEDTRDAYATAIADKQKAQTAELIRTQAHQDPTGRHGTAAGLEGQRGARADALAHDIAAAVAAAQKDDRPRFPPNLAKTGDIDHLRGTIAAGITIKPTGGGDRGAGTQGDMESRRGAIGDALAAATADKATTADISSLKAGVVPGLAGILGGLTGIISPNIVDTQASVETMRGTISNDLATGRTATLTAGAQAATASYFAGNQVAGAIAAKDLSIDQVIKINVNVSAAGVTKAVTVQNRYGPGNGSSGDDFRGGKPPGGQ